MSRLAGWRLMAAVAGVAGAALPLLAARRGTGGADRALAERVAGAVAGYLAVVARPGTPGEAPYDARALLVSARGLLTLPGWSAPIEVYSGRTPLVAAGAPTLPGDVWRDLVRREAPRRWRGGALVPLKDRDRWDVVGAVWSPDRAASPQAPLRVTGVAVLLVAAVAVWAVGRGRRTRLTVFATFTAAVVLHGVAAGAAVRAAARRATDRALEEARLLVQEAPIRLPGSRARVPLATLRRVVQGTGVELVEADSADPAIRRVTRAAGPRAVAPARLAPRRWAALETLPLEAGAGWWTVLSVALGLLGPALWGGAQWGAAASRRPRRLRETATAWTFLAPAAAHLAVFSFTPMLFAAWLSLHRWNLLEPVHPFVGLANFADLARDPLVRVSLRNTMVYALYVPATMALALAAALVLSGPGRIARWVRTAFFVPYVASVVAVALLWQWMLHADFGLLNWVLGRFGVAPVDWLGSPRTALLAVMLISAWVQLGYQMTVFVAGLQAIPQTYLDAARVDGADAWQRFRYVIVPLLRPVTLFVLVTGVIASFQVFTFVYVLTDGGPLHATDVIVYRIYQSAWEFLRFGYASALALVLLAVLLGVTWLQFRLLGRRVEYG